ncbi:MAG: glycosyltransferase family 9 protein [bacterium]
MSKSPKPLRNDVFSPGVTIPDCKHFTGYKPCFPDTQCYKECVNNDPIGTRILIINLDAMGNVLVTTSLLPAIKRKYPQSHISWITLKNAFPLLQNNPLLDRIFVWEPENRLILRQQHFDIVLNVDKSQRSGAFAISLDADEKLGFGVNDRGQIIPLNKEAEENYILGLDDHLKFRVNQKTVQQLQCEQFKLEYKRDEYVLRFTDEENQFCASYKKQVGISENDLVVGFNTGCSLLYPNKKMTIEQHLALIKKMHGVEGLKLVLAGGPEDTERNAEIARLAQGKVISTPTTDGLRRGLCYENICDVIISGDSFGMHAAIALRKHVLVWFGVSCWTEIDLYERGEKFIPHGLFCSPCWKRECPYNLECIQMIDLDAIVAAVMKYREGWKNRQNVVAK